MAHKTVNASEASKEILEKVREDYQEFLNIPVSLSDAIQVSSSAYFELKNLKIAAKKKGFDLSSLKIETEE